MTATLPPSKFPEFCALYGIVTARFRIRLEMARRPGKQHIVYGQKLTCLGPRKLAARAREDQAIAHLQQVIYLTFGSGSASPAQARNLDLLEKATAAFNCPF